jgi:hypothetical protein
VGDLACEHALCLVRRLCDGLVLHCWECRVCLYANVCVWNLMWQDWYFGGWFLIVIALIMEQAPSRDSRQHRFPEWSWLSYCMLNSCRTPKTTALHRLLPFYPVSTITHNLQSCTCHDNHSLLSGLSLLFLPFLVAQRHNPYQYLHITYILYSPQCSHLPHYTPPPPYLGSY